MTWARYAIVDAITAEDLRSIGAAVADHTLITGAAGLATGLPEGLRLAGLLSGRAEPETLPAVQGHAAVLAGSCSAATLAQLAAARSRLPVLELDPLTVPDPSALSEQALSWAEPRLGGTPVVIAASATPDRVERLQSRFDRAQAGALVEDALATVAEELVARGVRRLVVAGGETSGAVVSRLGVRSLRVGPEIDPGVPWTWAQTADGPLLLSLKSGNFGSPGYFLKAFGLHE